MKQQPTREQVLDALQTHKSVQKAANALHISYPEMQKYLRKYGICAGHVYKINHPEADVLITPARHRGQSAIADWFRRKFQKGE
jgi:hypothetical protein